MTTIYTAEQIRAVKFDEAKVMVKHNITTNDKWLVAALKAITKLQTSDEVSSEQTKHRNERGWSASDANQMTSFTKQILRWEAETVHRYNFPLSPRQIAKARVRIAKYAAQLTRIAQRPKAS